MAKTDQLSTASAVSNTTLNGAPPGPVDGGAGGPGAGPAAPPASPPAPPHDAIAGAAALRGLMLYGAVLAFAGIYVYFIVDILRAVPGHAPAFDGAIIAAAAALAGVLGSTFALKVGVPAAHVNVALGEQLAETQVTTGRAATRRLHQILSLEPADTNGKSWPLTFGVWVYAIVASAVAMTYITNQSETPGPVRAIAVTFAGYVLALLNSAYGIQKGAGQQ